MSKENLVLTKPFRISKKAYEILDEFSKSSGYTQSHIKQMLLQKSLLDILIFVNEYGGFDKVDFSLGVLNGVGK